VLKGGCALHKACLKGLNAGGIDDLCSVEEVEYCSIEDRQLKIEGEQHYSGTAYRLYLGCVGGKFACTPETR